MVVSPATHFKGATMNQWDDDWVVGLSGEIAEVPAGFAHETILHAGKGVTATVDRFGAAMQRAYGTTRVSDTVVDKVGYWTDNGAYYSGACRLPLTTYRLPLTSPTVAVVYPRV